MLICHCRCWHCIARYIRYVTDEVKRQNGITIVVSQVTVIKEVIYSLKFKLTDYESQLVTPNVKTT